MKIIVGPSKQSKYSHHHSASYSAVSHKRLRAKSQIPKIPAHFAHVKAWRASKNKGRHAAGITINSFDVCKKEWIQLGKVQFEVIKQHFGKDGFRNPFKAWSDNILFQNKSWSLKKYQESLKKIVDEWGTDAECQTRSNTLPFKASCIYV